MLTVLWLGPPLMTVKYIMYFGFVACIPKWQGSYYTKYEQAVAMCVTTLYCSLLEILNYYRAKRVILNRNSSAVQ